MKDFLLPFPAFGKSTTAYGQLPLERTWELLEFALFMKARQMKQPFQVEAYIEKFISPPLVNTPLATHPLEGTVIFYDDPLRLWQKQIGTYYHDYFRYPYLDLVGG